MRNVLFGLLACAALLSPASANQITAFGQSSNTNTISATTNITNTITTISVADADIGITQLFNNSPVGALFNLTAVSFDAVTTIGSALLQHYNGTFCLTSASSCGGINYLSGSFSDAAFGINGGAQLSINVAAPPDILNLSSDVISAANLISPSSFTLSFSNVTPGLNVVNETIAPFTASFSGVASAETQAVVAEPGSLALLGVGLLGTVALARRRRGVDTAV